MKVIRGAHEYILSAGGGSPVVRKKYLIFRKQTIALIDRDLHFFSGKPFELTLHIDLRAPQGVRLIEHARVLLQEFVSIRAPRRGRGSNLLLFSLTPARIINLTGNIHAFTNGNTRCRYNNSQIANIVFTLLQKLFKTFFKIFYVHNLTVLFEFPNQFHKSPKIG